MYWDDFLCSHEVLVAQNKASFIHKWQLEEQISDFSHMPSKPDGRDRRKHLNKTAWDWKKGNTMEETWACQTSSFPTKTHTKFSWFKSEILDCFKKLRMFVQLFLECCPVLLHFIYSCGCLFCLESLLFYSASSAAYFASGFDNPSLYSMAFRITLHLSPTEVIMHTWNNVVNFMLFLFTVFGVVRLNGMKILKYILF